MSLEYKSKQNYPHRSYQLPCPCPRFSSLQEKERVRETNLGSPRAGNSSRSREEIRNFDPVKITQFEHRLREEQL